MKKDAVCRHCARKLFRFDTGRHWYDTTTGLPHCVDGRLHAPR